MTLLKPFVLFRQQTLDCVSTFLRLGFLRDRRYYYDRYFGSDHPLVLSVKNLVRPSRLLKKFLYGQIVPLPSVLSLATPVEGLSSFPSEWQGYIKALKRDGIVFIPGFFKSNTGNLCDRYHVNPEAFPPSDRYKRFTIDLNDPDIFKIATDPMLLAILAGYYSCQPYLRHLPGINCTHPDSEKARESVGFNNFWHYDTANLMTAHILLNDVAVSDSCMFYAKGSHRTHRMAISKNDYYYSEAYMRDHFEIVPCVGEAGTLLIFDPNGLHRVDLKPGTFRSHLHLNFVPGNDILKIKPDVQSGFALRTEADLATLTPIQKRSLVHIPPAEGRGL
jgi:hypothetical protein